jgi:hypothetical protein
MSAANIIQSQYHASLEMMRQVVERCPDELWDRPVNGVSLWRIAYHALFYVHLYLQPTLADFAPWSRHRPDYEMLAAPPWDPTYDLKIGEPYRKQDLLDYIDDCHAQVDRIVPALDMAGASGFDWLPFSKLELQLYSIRHLQQHIGELSERLGAHSAINIDWVGQKHS